MKRIELHHIDFPVWVNPECIISVVRMGLEIPSLYDSNKRFIATFVQVGKETFYVKETPEEIFKLIEEKPTIKCPQCGHNEFRCAICEELVKP